MFKDSRNYSSWLYLKTDLFPLTLLAPLGTLYWDRLPTPDFGALSAPSLNIATGGQDSYDIPPPQGAPLGALLPVLL